MRLIALFLLVCWLTSPANAQTRNGEVRYGVSDFACRPEVRQALKVCEQNYRTGGDWLNPTYNDLRCRRYGKNGLRTWFVLQLTKMNGIGIRNESMDAHEVS
jgi:hypothetical protein